MKPSNCSVPFDFLNLSGKILDYFRLKCPEVLGCSGQLQVDCAVSVYIWDFANDEILSDCVRYWVKTEHLVSICLCVLSAFYRFIWNQDCWQLPLMFTAAWRILIEYCSFTGWVLGASMINGKRLMLSDCVKCSLRNYQWLIRVDWCLGCLISKIGFPRRNFLSQNDNNKPQIKSEITVYEADSVIFLTVEAVHRDFYPPSKTYHG